MNSAPKRKLICLFACAMLAVSSLGATAQLPGEAQRVIQGLDIPTDRISVYIHAVGEPAPRLVHNGQLSLNPASTIKLLTTYLALETLGPAYQWKTEAWAEGAVSSGTLFGNLYIKGYGDPSMVKERFWLFTREIMLAGVRDIRGDVVLDSSHYDLAAEDPGAFDGQPYRVYNVVPHALLVNYRSVNFRFRPDPVGSAVEVVADPMPTNLLVANQLVLASGGCGYQAGVAMAVDSPPQDRVVFSGRYSPRCGEYRMSRTVLDPITYTQGLFEDFWQRNGGTRQGSYRQGQVPEALEEPLVVVRSPNLSEVIRSVNKFSNNVMTRQILLTMGVEYQGPPATVEKGRTAVRAALAGRGLDLPELLIDNGAGLSRDTRISASDLGRVLLEARRSLYAPEFVASMPLAGLDGTMRRRFRGTPLSGRMHLKSGRLDHVQAVAGYVVGKDGQEYVVVVLQNYQEAHRGPGEELQNALLDWTYRQNGVNEDDALCVAPAVAG